MRKKLLLTLIWTSVFLSGCSLPGRKFEDPGTGMHAGTLEETTSCHLLKEASIAFCRKDYKRSLEYLLQFNKDYPEHSLIEEVNFQIAHIYYLINDFNSAKVELDKIINDTDDQQDDMGSDAFGCETNYDSSRFYCLRIVFPEPYVHLQHWAALDLHQIYLKEGDFEKALFYLKAADKKYPFSYSCGNGDMQKSIEIALLYGSLYQKMNMPDSALHKLLPYAFENHLADYSDVVNMSVSIIRKNYDIHKLRSQFDNAVDNLIVEEVKRNSGSFSSYSIFFLHNKIKLGSPYYTDEKVSKEQMQKELKVSFFYKELSK